MDNDLFWIIVIYAVGLGAMLIELVLPGIVLGILGFLAVCGSIVFAYATGHHIAATVLAALTILLIPCFFLAWKHLLGHVMAVKDDEKDFHAVFHDLGELVGKEGVATSALRPSGTALIDGNRHSVVTRGEMLDKGTRVKVIETAGNRITVKEA